MNCSSVDLKAFALGEASPGGGVAAHVETCESCREELERLRVTRAALLSLPEVEVPQRIAFVSDKVFEPRWWQTMWRSSPAMAFASAALLALAIFVHAFARPVNIAQPSAITTARIDQRIEREVDRRVQAAVSKTVAESRARDEKAAQMLDAAEKRFEFQRQEDIAMMEQAARYYENKIGQLMVASNRSYGGAQ